LEKLIEIKEKTKPIIRAIQGKVDESAKEMASQNAMQIQDLPPEILVSQQFFY
jgi:hypothetical protein